MTEYSTTKRTNTRIFQHMTRIFHNHKNKHRIFKYTILPALNINRAYFLNKITFITNLSSLLMALLNTLLYSNGSLTVSERIARHAPQRVVLKAIEKTKAFIIHPKH